LLGCSVGWVSLLWAHRTLGGVHEVFKVQKRSQMANHPSVLLCDQRTSTSALDPHSSQEILDFLLKVNRELGVTVVIVTHQMSIVNEICNKVGVMEAGRLVETFALADRAYAPVTDIGRLLVCRGHRPSAARASRVPE
jgi:ABC-type methionine transport system ATPase subunit